MRLTLRTLLAYLDDLLEPAQAKELGAKIQESEMAAELIMKIRDVIRKRRLSAPLVNGPGCDMDANIVAEYLDNTLPPEAVGDLEKICLESDLHLAEVAACHQILTLVLGEPVDIGSHSRERMYALAHTSPAKSEIAAERPAEPAGAPLTKPNPTVITPATVGLSRRAAPEVDSPRRGDSFIGRIPGNTSHPSARPPAKTGTNTPAGGQNGNAGVVHSPTESPVTPPASTRPAAASHTTPSGLGPAVKSVQNSRPPSATIPVAPAHDAPFNPTRHQVEPKPFDRTIPDYLKRPPLWKTRALPLAILLLIAVWVGTLLRDKNLLSGLLGRKTETAGGTLVADASKKQAAEMPASDVGNPDSDSTATPADAKSDEETVEPSRDAKPTKRKVTKPKDEDTEMAAVDPAVDAPPPLDEGDVAKPVPDPTEPDASEQTDNSNTKTKKPEEPEDDPTTVPEDKTEVASIDSKKPEVMDKDLPKATKPATPTSKTRQGADSRLQPRYVSTDGVVLRFDDDRDGWFPFPHRQFVYAEDILAVPELFDAQIQFGPEKHRMTAVGPTLFKVVETTDELPLSINIERGKIILQSSEPAGGAMQTPLNFSLNVQGRTWLIELPSPNTRCGIEIIPREPHQFEEDFGAQGWSGKLIVASGSVKITSPEGKVQIVNPAETFVLAIDPTLNGNSPISGGGMPNWIGERKLTSVARLNATQLQKALLQDELSAHDALLSAITDRVPEKSRLATACLGLIGDYPMMLEVLDRNEHHESRETAIRSLRSWVNLNPVNREKLKTQIGARFFKDDVDTIYRLIWGYQDQDLRSKQVSKQLVEWLSHDSLAVRELAYHYIKTLTNRRLDFDAREPQAQRNPAIQQLKRVLDKDGSLLPPLMKGAGVTLRRD
jgi:hypothetical protein